MNRTRARRLTGPLPIGGLVAVVGAALVVGVTACDPTGPPLATINPEPTAAAAAFTAVTDRRTGTLPDGTSWTVMLPQVRGGSPEVRAAFNGKLDSLLETITGQPSGNGQTIGDGGLGTAERSRTVIGERTLSGVVIVLANTKGAAHPNNLVETTVLNSETGETIDDPFADKTAAFKALAPLAAAGDSTGRLRDAATYASGFTSWIPLPEGLHVYVSVPHVMGDYVPVTIPWDKVAPLLKPDVREVLVH